MLSRFRNTPLRESRSYKDSLWWTKEYRSREVKTIATRGETVLFRQDERKRWIRNMYTDIRPRVSRETSQWKLRYRKKDQPGARIQEKACTVSTARATKATNYSNGIQKTSQLPSLRLIVRSVLGERPRSHTLYIRLFYVTRQLVSALYLPDNLTPIYGFRRVKLRVCRK